MLFIRKTLKNLNKSLKYLPFYFWLFVLHFFKMGFSLIFDVDFQLEIYCSTPRHQFCKYSVGASSWNVNTSCYWNAEKEQTPHLFQGNQKTEEVGSFFSFFLEHLLQQEKWNVIKLRWIIINIMSRLTLKINPSKFGEILVAFPPMEV